MTIKEPKDIKRAPVAPEASIDSLEYCQGDEYDEYDDFQLGSQAQNASKGQGGTKNSVYTAKHTRIREAQQEKRAASKKK